MRSNLRLPLRIIRRFRRLSQQKSLVLGSSLLLWVLTGLLLFRFIRGTDFSSSEQLSFEEALQSRPSGAEPEDSGFFSSQAQYGISQGTYDTWRYQEGLLLQDIAQMNLAEVHAIYQEHWQQGRCESFAVPLDMACLDTVISFGIDQGKELLAGLPPDPQIAALEVAKRRQALRSQILGGSVQFPISRQRLREGLERDRALEALVQSYTPNKQSQFSRELRQWLALPLDLNPDRVAEVPFSPGNPANSSASAPSTQLTADEIYAQSKPAVVEVWITTHFSLAPAAGVVLRSDGLILTNYHVVQESGFDFVKLADGAEYYGSLVAVDPTLDLALIQLEDARGLPVARFAETSAQLQLGDTVYAIGSPAGNHWQMTTAQIIQLASPCGIANLECIRTPEGFLKPGNSGGPLLDQFGQVVGINRAIQQQTGEGVSIPIETVKQFVERSTGRKL